MKIVICTTPIRPVPTDYPPFGSMAIIQSLRSAGYDPYFYDIDGLRPSFEEVAEFFKNEQPDIVGISAVVSTAYAYTKQLTKALRELVPHAKIVVGGNLAASADILHRFCQVDFCAIGEGEKVIVNLLNYLRDHWDGQDYSALRQIKGITYLDETGEMIFTGYENPISEEDFFEPDFSILERYSRIENFIIDPLTRGDFAQDPRTHEPHRRGKKMGMVISAKGCVARCTFCHRWDRGYRHLPPRTIASRIKYLMDRYNVGFLMFGDENFGSDRRALEELIELIKPFDILYAVSGVRCRSVDPQLLKKLKESGCVALYYGMETGSPTVLQVMEKKTSLFQNVNAARWTYEAGLYTIYQLVLAMPGETHETISETTEFLKSVTEFLPDPPNRRLSINYTQALPGTPVYEYARAKGFIGPSLEDEEAYLTAISDINALDDTKFLNFTEYDYLTVQSWRRRILFETMTHYLKRNRLTLIEDKGISSNDYTKGGYFNLSRINWRYSLYLYLYPFRTALIWQSLLRTEFRRLHLRKFLRRLFEAIRIRFRNNLNGQIHGKSLRAVMEEMPSEAASISEKSMVPLRAGR